MFLSSKSVYFMHHLFDAHGILEMGKLNRLMAFFMTRYFDTTLNDERIGHFSTIFSMVDANQSGIDI